MALRLRVLPKSSIRRLLLTGAGGVVALMATSVAASAASAERGHWGLNEVNSSIAVDSSGSGNDGTNYNVVGDGEAYTFNGVNARVIVGDAPSLDPGTADFSFGVTLSMAAPPALGETYDVVRKGLVTTLGGDYKVEVTNAKGKAVARCVVKDSAKVLAAIQSQATVNLADGAIHTVTCRKTSTSVTVQVDGLAPRTKAVTALSSVSNEANLALGAKAESTAKTGFDWYQGKMYDAWVAIGE